MKVPALPSSKSNEDIKSLQKDSFQPMWFAILNQIVHQQDSNEEDCDLECIEKESLRDELAMGLKQIHTSENK